MPDVRHIHSSTSAVLVSPPQLSCHQRHIGGLILPCILIQAIANMKSSLCQVHTPYWTACGCTQLNSLLTAISQHNRMDSVTVQLLAQPVIDYLRTGNHVSISRCGSVQQLVSSARPSLGQQAHQAVDGQLVVAHSSTQCQQPLANTTRSMHFQCSH